MAKLSDLFGRKIGEPEADKFSPPARPGNGHHGRGEPINVENFSDIGSRMGEENEALRNLLTDTGRKIGELDELKQAFDKLVQPFNSTLRALEQEKSQTLSLTSRLDESRSAYETLRNEFYQIEKRATALEAESERLRDDLELARESNRALESTRLALNDEINARHAQISELERQLAQETSQRRTLSEARRTLQDQLDAAEKRIVELRDRYDRLIVVYGDCGTGGALDAMLDRLGVERIAGPHCYEWYGGALFQQLMYEEPGTYFVTDFMVRQFHTLILKSMGLDRYPQLKDDYFGAYKRVVYLVQKPDPALLEQAKAAAAYLGLPLEIRATGYNFLEARLLALLQAEQAMSASQRR
jgi:predicted  nucleic acid-binding Zn-ribbon protein